MLRLSRLRLAITDELTITAWVYLNEMAAGNPVCLTWPADNCQLFNSRIVQAGTYDPVNLFWGIEDNYYRLLIEFGNFIFQAGPGAIHLRSKFPWPKF